MQVRGVVPDITKFQDIRVGGVFVHDCMTYMKVGVVESVNAVNLITGRLYSIGPTEPVTCLPNAVMLTDGVK
jgi:hypothetical protein